MKVDVRELMVEQGTRQRRPVRRVEMPQSMASELVPIFAEIARRWHTVALSVVAPMYVRQSLRDASPGEIRGSIDAASRSSGELIVRQTESLGRWVTRVATWHSQRYSATVKSALGVDVEPYMTLSEVEPVLREAIADGVSRLRDLDATARRRVEYVVGRAFAERWTKRRLTAELRAAMQSTVKRARGHATAQLRRIQAALTEYRQRQMGFEEYIWRTVGDDRVRHSHVPRNGRRYSWSRPPSGGHPGVEPNCRCWPEAVL